MKTKIDHIYWLTSYGPTSASTRYRGILPLSFLKNMGINYDFFYPERSIDGVYKFVILFLKIILFRKLNSIIVIQKVYSNSFYGNALKVLIKLKSKDTIYDIDDAEQYRRSTKTIDFFLRNCEYVSVGSSFLEKYCKQFNDNVFLQTSPVSLPIDKIKIDKNEKLHIGWVGDFGNGNSISKAFSHKTSLYKLFFPSLKKIKYPIKLSLIGVKKSQDIPELKNYFKNHPNIELDIPTNMAWTNDSWVYNKICQFDLGISLMINHPFNEGKSAFKAKQYLVCGVPVLANDIGEISKFVDHKTNGFICNSDFEIVNTINKVKDMSKEEYNDLSRRCLETKSKFSIDRYCKILLENTGIDGYKSANELTLGKSK